LFNKPPLSRQLQAGQFGTLPKTRFAATVSLVERPGVLPLAHGKRRLAATPSSEHRRAKIWELGASLHCSIVGTCLTTGELRALLRKFDVVRDGTSEHDLHHVAVSAVSGRGSLAKQIQKTLDRRHHTIVNRFGKAGTAEELRRCWDEALQAGDIPGAYWAALTHPAADDALVRHVFGAVHMLSHLVGAANRADIRRLHQLETEKTALEEKLVRQQARLHDAILTRDARIRELGAALSTETERRTADVRAKIVVGPDAAMLESLVADLRKQLDGEIRRRERAEARADEVTATHARSEREHLATRRQMSELHGELEAAEARLSTLPAAEGETDDLDLAGVTILYVGGRPHQIARLRRLVEQSAGALIHHDGGIEQRKDLLPGLVSRADAAFIPIDCVSHDAAQSLKRLCRLAGKPFVPLRSSGAASLLHALRSPTLGIGVPRQPA
jgi:hypothetical protein